MQDLYGTVACIIERLRVNEYDSSIWIGGMAENHVLDFSSARSQSMADLHYASTRDEIDELSDVVAESNMLVIRITYGAFPHSG